MSQHDTVIPTLRRIQIWINIISTHSETDLFLAVGHRSIWCPGTYKSRHRGLQKRNWMQGQYTRSSHRICVFQRHVEVMSSYR
jgi:hypothetical protein